MYNPLTTRAKVSDKSLTTRFFKKLSTTDENEKNYINTTERPVLKGCQSTKHITLAQSEGKNKMFSKNKKSQLQIVSLSKTVSKTHICLSQQNENMHHSSQNSKILRKENSSKNLKLGSSSS